MGWLTLPQSTSPSVLGSFTRNLSLGERPVCGAVTPTKGPMSASWPSPRRMACWISTGATRFQCTSPDGWRPCASRLPRSPASSCGFVCVAIEYALGAAGARGAGLEFGVDGRWRGRRGKSRLDRLGAFLRVHDRDGGHVDDGLHVGAALEHVHRASHADEDRPDGR